ncbi:MAG: hypothetical protein M3O36_18755, partial [Myxococcota bacterium]|nr:hypothetical protein [Myxococcota bacterium]
MCSSRIVIASLLALLGACSLPSAGLMNDDGGGARVTDATVPGSDAGPPDDAAASSEAATPLDGTVAVPDRDAQDAAGGG